MLSPEDILRLNTLILLSDAIRIDEYKMCIFGLDKKKNEHKIQLNPSGDLNKYLTAVKELIVNKVLGSMGGYPSYLKRWSRMGSVSTKNLQSLLKLGDIQAVIAVANNKKLADNILDLVWWCATNTDEQANIARYLLSKEDTKRHRLKYQIAQYLLEFIPFITDVQELMDTVNLLLQNGLISEENKLKLWQQGQRKTAFLIGFLERMPNNLPTKDIKTITYNNTNKQLNKVLSKQGQIFLQTSALILKKINQEYVLYRLLEILGKYCYHQQIKPVNDIKLLQKQVDEVIQTMPNEIRDKKMYSLLLLAGVSELLVIAPIASYALMGSTIRKKLAPILNPIKKAIDELLGKNTV